jgi:hypothetical protein
VWTAALYTPDDLDRLLTGVYLDLAPIHPARRPVPAGSGILAALWQRRQVKPDAAGASTPIRWRRRRTGRLPVAIDAALHRWRTRTLRRHYPAITAVGVDTSPTTKPATGRRILRRRPPWPPRR